MLGTVVRLTNPLVGWQEIDEADDAEEWASLRRCFAHGYTHVGERTAVPISVPGGLEVRKQAVTVVSPGRSREAARVVGTAATPQRHVTQVLLGVKRLPSFPPFVDLNGHLPYRVPDLWAQAHQGWRQVAREWDAYPRLTQRDTNRHGRMPSLQRDERQLLRRPGIDKITLLPGPRLRVKVIRRRTVHLTIDGHNAEGALVRLTAHNGDALQLWVVTANVGRGVTHREARANIALVRRGFRQAA